MTVPPLRPVVLGVDSSTSSTKVEARSLDDGEVLAIGRSPHPATTPPCSEQDPAAWWTALSDAVAQLGDVRNDVVAISVAAQQHGLVVTDLVGTPLRHAKLWNDTESATQATRMVDDLGARRWSRECGSVPVPAFTITKLAWLIENEPMVALRTEKVFLPHDWLTFALTGNHVTDRGDASGTGWYDPSSTTDPNGAESVRSALVDCALGKNSPAGTSTLNWLTTRLPRVLGPAQAAGVITPSAAAELGLSNEVLVGPGTGDNMAAAAGLGLEFGDVVFSLGTSGTVYTKSPDRTTDPEGEVAGFADATGWFLPLVCTLNATKVTDTVATWLGTDAAGLADLALRADPNSTSLPQLVPYFDGERTPNLPEATGSMLGLRTTTTREEVALAAHDGVLNGVIAGRGALRRVGALVDRRTFLVGGGARSAAYRQRLADLTGSAVIVPHEGESVAAGAAVQAAVVGLWRQGSSGEPSPTDVAAIFSAVAEKWGLGKGQLSHPRA